MKAQEPKEPNTITELAVRHASKLNTTSPLRPSGNVAASRAVDLGSIPAFPVGLFPGRVTPCQASGFIGSALGLVGPVVVHWDWV